MHVGGLRFRLLGVLAIGTVCSWIACSGGSSGGGAIPTITLSFPVITAPSKIVLGSQNFSASVAETQSGVNYSWTIQNGKVQGASSGTSVTFAPEKVGSLTLTCQASMGSETRSTSTQILVQGIPPQAPQIIAPASVYANSTGLKASLLATETDTAYTWTATNAGIASGAGTSEIMFAAGSPGTLSLSCTATNAFGTSSSGLSIPVVAPPPADNGVSVAGNGAVTISNRYFKWVIGADGQNLGLFDARDQKEYTWRGGAPYFANIKKAGITYEANRVAYQNGQLVVGFGNTNVFANIEVKMEQDYFTLEVAGLNDPQVEELTFINVALALRGTVDESFSTTALALNLQTNVPTIPGPNQLLRATAYQRLGVRGAKVAIIACPQEELRGIMKQAISLAPGIPSSKDVAHPPVGGPWALDAPINRGSYLFNFGDLTESTVDQWIQSAKSVGMNQIVFFGWRDGDLAPNATQFPRGKAGVKAVTDKLHLAGISAGLHTNSFFIDKASKYVTPVPDPRLGKDSTFTLTSPVLPGDAVIPVAEPTTDMSLAVGYVVRNSVTVQIDNELIIYSGISKTPPYAFTNCKRGSYGTLAAPHSAGSKVFHLKETYGLFVPDPDSTLFAEIAHNTSTMVNDCGFDMIYMDAIDAQDILAGAQLGWHYGSKFVFDIADSLDKPALFEMSTYQHHYWFVRGRTGSWDHPTRSHKHFVDLHIASNEGSANMLLPTSVGWWRVQTWDSPAYETHSEPTFPDDIEYLMSKCLGNDMGFSLMGLEPGIEEKIPAFQRLTPIFKQYETLRQANYFPEAIKSRLRNPGEEFTLEEAGGKWQFRPVNYDKHKVQGADPGSLSWVSKNPYASQPIQFRLQVLMSAGDYDAPQSRVIEDFGNLQAFTDRAAEPSVSTQFATSAKEIKSGNLSALFSASSTRLQANGAWAKVGRSFAPALDLSSQKGLGVWVYGDGQGELLNVQLKGSPGNATDGIGDHYVPIDFQGWRYFELVEIEGGNRPDLNWPYSGNVPGLYIEPLVYSQIESLSLWFNNLPSGKKVSCYLSPVKALPLVSAKLKNFKITIGGNSISIPDEIESGAYLEFRSMTDCKLYDRTGKLISSIQPTGQVPILGSGDNQVEFACTSTAGLRPRLNVTVISRGEALQ